MEYTNRQLSELLDINFAKQKRHAREFLGVDPEAGQSSGIDRKLNLEQAFIVYFCGIAVNRHKVPMSEAKKLSKNLPEWLERKLYFPVMDNLLERLKDQRVPSTRGPRGIRIELEGIEKRHLDWTIQIARSSDGYQHNASGLLYNRWVETLDNHWVVDKSFLYEPVGEPDEPVGEPDEPVGEPDSVDPKGHNIHSAFINVTGSIREYSDRLGLQGHLF